MREDDERSRLLFLPVRRRLMAVTLSYLLGIYLTAIYIPHEVVLCLLCLLLLAWAVLRLRQRKQVLFLVMACMLLLGSLRAGSVLRRRDLPTSPGVQIEGTVKRIIKPYRVVLEDVRIDGEARLRPVAVTLMQKTETEDDGAGEAAWQVQIGQQVKGKGRLFQPEEPRNTGGMDRRVQALCEGYELSGYMLPGWEASGKGRWSPGESLRRLRERIAARVNSCFGEQSALFRGVMLGDKSGMDSGTTSAMRLTGTAHILTVSGMHLSMMAGLLACFLGRMPVGRRMRFAILSAFLLLFTGLTGGAPGTVRACIMVMLREYAHVRSRRYEPLTALACAALLMTLVKPLWALHASFQFSFFVVLGILLISQGISDGFRRHVPVGGALRSMLSTAGLCMSAQIASVPMQLLLYGFVPVLSLPMNLLCGIWMPVLLLGGWGTILVGLLLPGPASGMASLLAAVARSFEQLALRAAVLDHAILRLPSPHGVLVMLFAGCMLLVTHRIRYGKGRRAAALTLLCLILAGYAPRLMPQTRYTQLDVGQGDAALIANGRRAVLVDVGPEDSYDMLRYLRHEGLFVDAVILSHLDEDHAGALEVLLSSEIRIPAVITAQGQTEEMEDTEASPAVRQVLQHLQRESIPIYRVGRGDRISAGGIIFDVLSPDQELTGSNERSLLLHAEVEDVSILLTGDLPQEAEPALVPHADVLKVAHHGSRYSTSETFLEQAAPKLAIISVGANNRYGHPGQRVLDALEQTGAQILRTDESGGITLWLCDGMYRVETYKAAGKTK